MPPTSRSWESIQHHDRAAMLTHLPWPENRQTTGFYLFIQPGFWAMSPRRRAWITASVREWTPILL